MGILDFIQAIFTVILFLFRFHHLSMLFITVSMMLDLEPIQRLTFTWNYGVHSVMYTYFALTVRRQLYVIQVNRIGYVMWIHNVFFIVHYLQ